MSKPKKEKPDGMVLYQLSLQTLAQLPPEIAGTVIKSACCYFLDGELPEFSPSQMVEQITFSILQKDIDAGLAKYRETVERNTKNRNAYKENSPDSPVVTSGDHSSQEVTTRDQISPEVTTHDQLSPEVTKYKYKSESEYETKSENESESESEPETETKTEREPEGEKESQSDSQSESQSDSKRLSGDTLTDRRTDRPTDGQTPFTPPQIKTAWARYYGRSMSTSDEIGVQALLDTGYSEQQILDKIRYTAEHRPSYPLQYLRKALSEIPISTRSPYTPDARVSERERENYRRFQEHLASTHI